MEDSQDTVASSEVEATPEATSGSDASDASAESSSADEELRLEGRKALVAERAAAAEARKALKTATARVAALEAESLALKHELLVRQVAAEKGLPPALAGRLQGQTAEELAADADQLLALVTPASPPPQKMPVDPFQGGAPGNTKASAMELFVNALKARG